MEEHGPGSPDEDLARRVARVRVLLFAGAALVATYLVTRWILGSVWPDQHDLSDIGTGFLRVGVSAVVAVVVSLVVLARLSPRKSR